MNHVQSELLRIKSPVAFSPEPLHNDIQNNIKRCHCIHPHHNASRSTWINQNLPDLKHNLPRVPKEEPMKELSQLNLPDDVRYSKDHEWARPENGLYVVGITDYAQDQLGDIVFVELPEKGSTFAKDDDFGTVESVKSVSELFMPIGGEVVEINDALEESPERVNGDPYGEGWMIKIKPDNPDEYQTLLDAKAYLDTLKG
jgi:glycine cleavage system H protein